MRLTNHSKQRIIERNEDINYINEAKKAAKQAYSFGKTIDKYQSYPQFYKYLQKKLNQSRECRIRVYKDNIYIWKGSKRSLVTAHPIPDRFKEELNIDSVH